MSQLAHEADVVASTAAGPRPVSPLPSVSRGRPSPSARPLATPTEGLDHEALARLQVSGGAISNMGLASAFLAASEGSPVRMTHVHQAALDECAKQGKAITPGEVEGWLA